MSVPSNQVRADQVLTAGIRAEFIDAYKKHYEGIKDRMGAVIEFDVPSDKKQEIFAYFKSAPYPRRWDRGDEASFGTFDSVQWTVPNIDWVNGVTWHENDEQDDQTRSLVDRARDAGRNFGTLDERVFFQILLASTDPELLKSIPNAPDGSDLYHATDGAGNPRFGVSGGNILSGQTLNTAAGIRAAIFNVVERFGQFQDTEGQPLWDPTLLEQGFQIFYNITNDQLMREAVLQSRTLQVGGTDAGAAVTNIIMESGLNIKLSPTQRITDSNLYIFAEGAPHKAIFTLARQPMRETPFDRTNSDAGRMRKEKGMLWDARRGYGVFLPYQTIQATA